MLFHHRTVIDDLFFLIGQVFEGNVGPDTHGAADVGHERPHQRVPGCHGALVDGKAFIRNKSAPVHRPYPSGPSAAPAGASRIEGEVLGSRAVEALSADRTDDLAHQRDLKRWRGVVSVRTAVGGEAGEHQAEAVEQFGARPEGRTHARNARPLVQRQRRGNV